MKWICLECGEEFNDSEIEYRKEDDDFKYGDEYGSCPFCKSFEIEELEEK